MSRDITIRGAQVWDPIDRTELRDLHIVRGRIAAQPGWRALTVDLDGYAIFPALVNGHDHLELNHFPRTKFRERYDNAHQWGEDVSARLDEEPFKSLRAYPLKDRCFIGGLKNLLCGALTVAHHNPPHKCLFERDFSVCVLRKYGWAHSLHFSTEDEIVRSYRATPSDTPWFIHLAEGTDEVAASEYRRLKALGCIGKNTIIVHGVGMTDEDIADAAPRVRGLVVCPTTNIYLLGQSARIDAWSAAGGVWMLGSDSRLTADGDLLDEWCAISSGQNGRHSWRPYTVDLVGTPFLASAFSASIARYDGYADYIAFRAPSDTAFGEAERAFCNSRRADLAIVARGGIPQIGDPDVMAKFPYIQTIPAMLDGRPKRINVRLAQQIARCTLHEPGLELDTDFVGKDIKKV